MILQNHIVMKTNFKIIVLLFLGNFAFAQQAFFFGTYRPKENGLKYDCQSAKEYILKEVADNKEFQTLSKEFYNSHNYEWPYTVFLKADSPFVIYKSKNFRKWEKCTYMVIDVAQESTMEKVLETIRRRKQDYKFEDEQILYTHNPKPKDVSKKIIEKNYGELSAKYTIVNSATTKAILVAFKNNSKNNALVITIYKNPKNFDELNPNQDSNKEEPQIIVLQPGYSTNVNLKTEDFSLEIYTKDKDEEQDNASWINWIKEKIKHHVIKEPNYKEKGGTTCMCIRG